MAKGIVSREELFGKLAGSFKEGKDPLREMFEWLTNELMQMEMTERIGADKYERSAARKGFRAGTRSKPRRWDTRLGTMSLWVPKPRSGGYVPSFMERGQRSEKALCSVVMEAFVQGVSTRKMESLFAFADGKGIERRQADNFGQTFGDKGSGQADIQQWDSLAEMQGAQYEKYSVPRRQERQAGSGECA